MASFDGGYGRNIRMTSKIWRQTLLIKLFTELRIVASTMNCRRTSLYSVIYQQRNKGRNTSESI